jgi:hypothetical protein
MCATILSVVTLCTHRFQFQIRKPELHLKLLCVIMSYEHNNFEFVTINQPSHNTEYTTHRHLL